MRLYRSGLLDYGERRVLVVAPPRQADPLLPVGQLVQGNLTQATNACAPAAGSSSPRRSPPNTTCTSARHSRCRRPIRRAFRIAALSTNVGWAPGAIVMNADDYARAWGSRDASAYSILLAPGVSPTRGAARDRTRAWSPTRGSPCRPPRSTRPSSARSAVKALARLTQIATLILIASVLAMAAAIGAMIWQRRPRLAKLKLEGLHRAALWHTILLESLLLLGAGCLSGAIFGLYGQQLADRALADTINFPVVYSVTALGALQSLALVIATALAVLALPGYLAASVPAALALQD